MGSMGVMDEGQVSKSGGVIEISGSGIVLLGAQ